MIEQYEDRCRYAHGSRDVHDARSDAAITLLCLHEVIDAFIAVARKRSNEAA